MMTTLANVPLIKKATGEEVVVPTALMELLYQGGAHVVRIYLGDDGRFVDSKHTNRAAAERFWEDVLCLCPR